MIFAKKEEVISRTSYWQVFRLIFVFFSFYLLRDAFYRWDYFEAPFSVFLPNLGLVSIFWSFIAALTALLIWLSIKIISLFQLPDKWNYAQRLFLFLYLFLSLGAAFFITRRLVWLDTPAQSLLKLIIYAGGTLAAIFLTMAIERFSLRIKWMNKVNVVQFLHALIFFETIVWVTNRMVSPNMPASLLFVLLQLASIVPASLLISWLLRNKFDLIQDSITPLVWLFGLFVLISIPLVFYHTVWKQTGEEITGEHVLAPEAYIKRPNIILVTFDSLAASNMSVYGYNRLTTPYISEWAGKASLFTGLKAAGNNTSSTISSIVTGKRVWTHRVFDPHGYDTTRINRVETENLPKLLRENGYYNTAHVTAIPLSKMALGEYFDIIAPPNSLRTSLNFIGDIDLILYRYFGDKLSRYDWIVDYDFIFGRLLLFIHDELSIGKKGIRRYDLKKVFNRFADDMDNGPPEPFFAYIHIYQPHGPYIPFSKFKGSLGPVPVNDNPYTNRDRYDEVILSCDEQFKVFIVELEKMDILKNTIVILSSDHGEMFENYKSGHGGYYLNEAQTGIPLIIRNYENEEGRVIDDVVEQIDITATILDLADIPVPSWMEGRSLVPLIRGEKLAAKPAYSMTFEKNKSLEWITKGVVAVWEGDYKLIYYLEENESLLFNLKQDPGELNNLYDKEPAVGQRMLKMIQDNLEAANERFSRDK